MQNITPLALSFDGNMMLALDHNGNINLYVWVGVEWKQHVTVVTGDGDVADISRDGTYIVAGKLSRCECRNREGL